ncbi:MAG: Rne/Rng family ribonuclease [Candidatus Omnitrophica bacterium]|nr:Rne/Rng family ribonuclease [Candidatus Omnitrophota bacterium]
MDKYRVLINNEKVILRIVFEKNGKIDNFFVYKPDFGPQIGNIYKGKIERVLPGLNSAFINIGEMKSGFLQFDTKDFYVLYDEFEELPFESRILSPENEILVQICKPGEREKSPKVSENIVLPGRYFVFLPNLKIQKISRKIEDRKERNRLFKIFRNAIGGKYGFIIRTASKWKSEDIIYKEIRQILNIWKKIKRDYKKHKAPYLLWKELPVYLRIIRDYVDENCVRVEVDDEFIFSQVEKYINFLIPELKGKIFLYKNKVPIFIYYDLENEIENFISKKVFLPSGGHLIIEKGETLTSIDVNTGRAEDENVEETVLRTNLEAADEIPRQIRCRNISGIIIIDFINMKKEDKKQVFKKFITNLSFDKAKFNILFTSNLGILGLTREKNDYSIYDLLLEDCELCNGIGLRKNIESVFLEIKKRIFEILNLKSYNYKLEIELSRDLYEFIFKNQLFKNLVFSDRIELKVNLNFKKGEFKIEEKL